MIGLASSTDLRMVTLTKTSKRLSRDFINPPVPMLPELLIAFGLLALCVVVHSVGLSILLPTFYNNTSVDRMGGLQMGFFLIKIASWLLMLHLIEIALWAFCFYILGCLPDIESAFYFSGSSYSTLGYGDIILPKQWRMLGPAEGLSGILLCGLSTGFFFAVVSRVYRDFNQLRTLEDVGKVER
jgi:uncharacterized membrane protein